MKRRSVPDRWWTSAPLVAGVQRWLDWHPSNVPPGGLQRAARLDGNPTRSVVCGVPKHRRSGRWGVRAAGSWYGWRNETGWLRFVSTIGRYRVPVIGLRWRELAHPLGTDSWRQGRTVERVLRPVVTQQCTHPLATFKTVRARRSPGMVSHRRRCRTRSDPVSEAAFAAASWLMCIRQGGSCGRIPPLWTRHRRQGGVTGWRDAAPKPVNVGQLDVWHPLTARLPGPSHARPERSVGSDPSSPQ